MYIFVYGTLKKDENNHFRLCSPQFICSTGTSEKYVMIDLGDFPGVLRQQNAPGFTAVQIVGEVYDIPEKNLEELDTYEGEWYIREEIQLEKGIYALMYFLREMPGISYKVLKSGNWSKNDWKEE